MMVGIVTCDKLGSAISNWITNNNSSGSDEYNEFVENVYNAIKGRDMRLKSVTRNASTGIVTFTVGDTDGTDNDVKYTYDSRVSASYVTYNGDNWFLGTDASTVQEALDQLSNFLATAFGDDLVILNNPTFYIRENGASNPDITTQADLAHNPFNSFSAVRTFIQRSYIVGSISINARGTYDDADTISAANMKNASSVTIYGDSSDVSALTLTMTPSDGVGTCINVDGVDVTLIDATLNIIQKDTKPGRYGAARVSDAVLYLRGNIRVTGTYSKDVGSQEASSAIFWSQKGGNISTAESNIQFALGSSNLLTGAFWAVDGGTITPGPNSTLTFTNQLNVTAFWYIAQGSGVTAYMSNKPVPVMAGSAKINCTYVWRISNLATYVSSYFSEEFSASYWPTLNAYASSFSDYCVVNGAMGKDL